MSKAKQLPAYNIADIERTITNYATTLYDSIHKSLYKAYRDIYIKAHDTGEIDVDAYIEVYEKETTTNLSYKQFIQVMCIYRDIFKDIGNEEGLTIVNKLIGDRKLFNKIKFCSDGSYRNNRIWANVEGSMLKFDIRSRGLDKPETNNPRDIRKYIGLVFRSYPVVFIQVPIGTSDDINSSIDWMYDREYFYD